MPPAGRVPIRFGALGPLFALLGMTPGRSYLDLGEDVVDVRMGWAFRARVPRGSISSARRVGDTLQIGVHGWRGRWIVNGAGGPMVELSIAPPARARAVGFPAKLSELLVSVDDPDALVVALEPS
jgi:hypothetical protein